jgi:hypothetical protein
MGVSGRTEVYQPALSWPAPVRFPNQDPEPGLAEIQDTLEIRFREINPYRMASSIRTSSGLYYKGEEHNV